MRRRREQKLRADKRRKQMLLRRKRAREERKRQAELKKRWKHMSLKQKRAAEATNLLRKFHVNTKRSYRIKKRIRKYYGKKIYPTDCDLTVEVFPLYYSPVIRQSSFKLAFASSCMPKKEINFEAYYYKNYQVSFYHNPTTINLKLWGNKYIIKYGKPLVIDKYDIMKALEYQRAKVMKLLLGRTATVNTIKSNIVFLNPKSAKTFNRYTLKKLDDLDGLCECRLLKKKLRGWKILKKIHEQRKRQYLKQQAEQQKAIDLARDAVRRAVLAKMRQGTKPRRLKGVKKVKKKGRMSSTGRFVPHDKGDLGKLHFLPYKYHSKKNKVRRVMARKYIIDMQINCNVS